MHDTSCPLTNQIRHFAQQSRQILRLDEYWAAVVKPGTILFEVTGLQEAAARECLARVAYKMPFKCRFVTRRPNV